MKTNINKSNYPVTLKSTLNLSLLIAALLFAYACQPFVVFDQAMPPETDVLTNIPIQFLGTYVCESDSSLLYIDRDKIYKESYYEFITTRERVAETEDCNILAGGIFLPGREECVPVTSIGTDSIYAQVYDIHTLFSFQENETAKLYKGHLFLNVQDDRKNWYSFLFTPNIDGSIDWNLITVPNDLEKIKAITPDYTTFEVNENTKQYILSPTLKEFDKVLEQEYFLECDHLTPVRSKIFLKDTRPKFFVSQNKN